MSETAVLREIKAILATWYKPAQAKIWWTSRQPMFNDAIPTEMLEEGRTKEMLRKLKLFDAGVYF